jgi:ABC-type multidrug transport system permease subunit
MKLLQVIIKNFKLLIRSKASAFTVLIGPLLIILLVSLAFSTKSTYELSIGYVNSVSANSSNNLTASFVDTLKQSKYYVQEFPDEQSCVNKIEQGVVHTCIIFPTNFQISNEQRNEIRFLVDYSRINLVYKVIGTVSDILDIGSEEVSYSLTQTLLSRINSTVKDLKQDLTATDGLSQKLSLLMLDLQDAKAKTESMTFESGSLSLGSIGDATASLNESIISLIYQGEALINQSEEFLNELGSYENVTDVTGDFEKLRDDILTLHNTTSDRLSELEVSINVASDSLSNLEASLEQNKQLNQAAQQKLDSAKNNLALIQASVLDLKKALDKTRQSLEGIAITQAETIVSPVNTKIEPVVSESSKLTFTFPFLLVLVIMFVGLLLSSSIVIFEKSSKSFFRNHISPTRQEFFIISTFITSLIVVLFQTIIILGLANYFMHIPLFKNFIWTVLLVFVASAFFIVLGMAIGYLFSTQEAAIMGSLIIGSVFLFISNMIIPLESFAPWLSNIISYNPFVLSSELLRKSLLFEISIKESLPTLLLLGGSAILIFILIILGVGLRNKKRIKFPKEPVIAEAGSASVMKEDSSASNLKLVVGDRAASNKEELLQLVSDISKAEFEEVVNSQENKIADWAEKVLDDKKLASKLRKTGSRKEMIRILSEEVKKDNDDEEEGEPEPENSE